MKICYVPHRFNGHARKLLDTANEVIENYMGRGYVLTLRQLFYRLVTKNVIANTQEEYKRLGATMTRARLAGETDWEALVDITRNIRAVRNWPSPEAGMKWMASQYHTDMWANQDTRVELWIEKDALSGVFGPVCAELDVPFFSCRGYNSASEMWRASQRILGYSEKDEDKEVVVLHFGDHDPSGLDMTRDVDDRLTTFRADPSIERMALNMSQVKSYGLPPNPARKTDARFREYRRKFGESSWELDALEPDVLADMARKAILKHRDGRRWKIAEKREKRERRQFDRVAAGWHKAVMATK